MNKKFDCVILDFDGTLADTTEGILATFCKTLDVMGIPRPTDQEIKATIGLPLKQNFLVALPGIEESLADECVVKYRELFNSTALPVITGFPGVNETLEALHRAGVRMYIATSRSNRSVGMLCQSLGIDGYFEGVYTAESVKRHKPAPDMALLVLSEAGMAPERTLVVGDTTFDLQMGKSAGCSTCGVTYGNHSRSMLETAGPDYLIDDFSKLAEIVLSA